MSEKWIYVCWGGGFFLILNTFSSFTHYIIAHADVICYVYGIYTVNIFPSMSNKKYSAVDDDVD